MRPIVPLVAALVIVTLAGVLSPLGLPAAMLGWGVVLIVVYARRHLAEFRRMSWRWLGVAFITSNLLWLASDAVRVSSDTASHVPAAASVLADTGSALLLVVILWITHLRGRPRIETWLDAPLVVLALIPAAWLTILEPAAESSSGLAGTLVWTILAFATLGIGAVYILSGGIWTRSAILLAAGVIVNLVVGTAAQLGAFGADTPQFALGFLLFVPVALDPHLGDAFRRGGRETGIPLSIRVWMLVPVVAMPIATLEYGYVLAEPVPTALIVAVLLAIAVVIGVRAVLLHRAGIRDWSVPLTISLTALLVAGVAVSLTLLSQSARQSSRQTVELSGVLPEVKQLDGLLLRSIEVEGETAKVARSQWTAVIRRLERADVAPRRELRAYVTAARAALDTPRAGRPAEFTGSVADLRIHAAQTNLTNTVSAEITRRQATTANRTRWVRLFTVTILMTTLLLIAALLLRFNHARRRIELQHEQTHDGLTGLPNRVALVRHLSAPVPHGGTGNRTLVLLDLDDFKAINDSLGHGAGDTVLCTMAERLRPAVRGEELLLRLEGDAFAVVAPPGRDPLNVARRILAVLAEPIELPEGPQTICGSIGIAAVDEADPDRHGAVFRDAELAMYNAKRVGGNSIEIFARDMHERARDRIQLAADLREALDADGLALAYQPIVDLKNGSVKGYEALLRWTHPTRGPMSPAEFIPIAEQSGLIVDIGGWVLDTATAQLAEWQRGWNDERYISVNVAAAQFATRVLEQQVQTALAASGLGAEQLLLEVTESSLIVDLEDSVAQMHAVRALGVRFALDDFGTGYSSLSYLRRFPVDVLKVDKAFIDELDDPDGNLLVQAIVNMAASLRLRVVAEGIEEADQAAVLQQFDCHLGQGYHFSRPLPMADVEGSPRAFMLPAPTVLRAVG